MVVRSLVGLYAVAVVYLCMLALWPNVTSGAPLWVSWFGKAGSEPTIVVVLLLPGAAFVCRWLVGRKIFTTAPALVLSTMAVSAVALGMSAYWRCNGDESQFFAPLAWTLGLFLGNTESRFDPDAANACAGHVMPVALEIARLLAIATTLTTAVAAVVSLLGNQLDRIAIWRARSLTVVVGIDDETISMIDAIARTTGDRETLVTLTGNANSDAVARARKAGAKVQVVNLEEPSTLAHLKLWRWLDRLYLLSEDPIQNLARYEVIDAAVARLRGDRLRLPLTIRIDNPWEAELWRRNFLSHSGQKWAADAVGRYEITAAKLVRHVSTQSSEHGQLTTVVLCGLSPLTYALSSEFAQVKRERELYQEKNSTTVAEVVIIAQGADSFVYDHHLRQDRMAPDGETLPVHAVNVEPTVEYIDQYLQGRDPSTCAVVLSDPSNTIDGTRLVARFPGLRVYQVSAAATKLAGRSLVGLSYTFPINMDLDDDAPQDVWERAAELIHEHYSAGTDRNTETTKPWKSLHPLVKQSNRRQVLNTLWMVERHGHQSWNTLDGPSEPLPAGFHSWDPPEQLAALGFTDPDVIELMLITEHEDWRRFWKAVGWEHGPRSWEDKKHEKLQPWADMKAENPDFVQDSKKSLASTLINLRSLGYRSKPVAPSAADDATASGE